MNLKLYIVLIFSVGNDSHRNNNDLITVNYWTSDVMDYNPWAYGMNEKSAAGMYFMFFYRTNK